MAGLRLHSRATWPPLQETAEHCLDTLASSFVPVNGRRGKLTPYLRSKTDPPPHRSTTYSAGEGAWSRSRARSKQLLDVEDRVLVELGVERQPTGPRPWTSVVASTRRR